MKTYTLYLLIFLGFFGSCMVAGEDDDTKAEKKKNVSSVDLSITRENAYNDLWLDSTKVENYIAENNLPDSMARRIRSFYNARNFSYAWFHSGGMNEQTRAFWNLHFYHTSATEDTSFQDKELHKKMDALVAENSISVSADNKSMLNTELKLTQHLIHFFLNTYEKGFVKRKEMERFVPRKKEDVMEKTDSFLNKKNKDDRYFEDVNQKFGALKEQLQKYHAIAKAGGWPTITSEKSIKKGASSPAVLALKQRLQISGEMPAGDTTLVFNDTLEMAVRQAQRMFGYTPDGVASAALIKELNVPAVERVKQLMVNIERMRWMPNQPSGKLILVNIPEFILHFYEGEQKAFDMVVVVGKEGHNTVAFSENLSTVVFSPYWNVPPSIVKSEIMPAMNRNPGYLDGQNMEVVNNNGGMPTIRQRPGPGNALGKVKFLFPNSFNIYFHDTPSKSLFNRDKRAFSHGCIRLAEPEKMASYLLKDDPEWNQQKIQAAMNSGSEKHVRLKESVPVFITYYTAWVDEQGILNFREDIYKHDEKLMKRMFF